jgi:FtsP/CotA-like multicopper oxidase with cupredoxin domain
MDASSIRVTRRGVLKLGAGAAAACAVGSLSSTALAQPKAGAVLRFRMYAQPGVSPIRAGAHTPVWRFRHLLVEGPAEWLTRGPGYLGPTIRVPRGTRIICDYTNNLAQPSNIHWHGLDVPSDQDGHPKDAVPPGGTRRYDFVVDNPAGTYWYHPHPDMLTGVQAYMGLAGLFIITDKPEAKLKLPDGACDLALVLQDRTFDATNTLVYGDPSGVVGMLGDHLVINGRAGFAPAAAGGGVAPTIPLTTSLYRLRLLNGANSRIFKLAFSDGTPITVIGTDGGLLPAPVTRSYLMLSPGERAELLLDCKTRAIGSQLVLRTLSFSPIMAGAGALPNGTAADVARFEVTTARADDKVVPTTLIDNFERFLLTNAANQGSPRRFAISYQVPGSGPNCDPCWLLNGAVYDLNTVAPNEEVPADTLEVVEVDNPASGPAMPHPIHFHGRSFQVLSRTRYGGIPTLYNNIKDGFVETGWKDTFLIWPGERVLLLVKWPSYRGLFVYHCHNLEHEDMGMMRNLRVV